MLQAALTFDEPAPPVAPPAVDPHLPGALRRIQQEHNQRLLSRLLSGSIGSDELERCRALYGKRGSARLHDIRQWLRALGYQGDPLPPECKDAVRGLYVWQFTDAARAMARAEMEARR